MNLLNCRVFNLPYITTKIVLIFLQFIASKANKMGKPIQWRIYTDLVIITFSVKLSVQLNEIPVVQFKHTLFSISMPCICKIGSGVVDTPI